MSISEPQAGQTGEPTIPWQLVHDRYRIVRDLGTGAFGTVFVADDEQTPRRVAIRVLPLPASAAPNVARIIQNTSRSIMAAPTSHPSLVGVLEVGEVEPGRLFIVTELVEGRRLSEMLAAGNPLDFDPVRKWVLDLGGAIEVLHNLGLLHGAIRPRNVMLLADGRVKLMDIELAGLRDTPTLRDDKAPAEYLAPEQTMRAPWTEKTDTYAFGLLVYDVFCGGPPSQASTLEAVVAKQPTGTPAPMRRRRALPESMESIVMQALEKDPDRRPWMHEVLNSLWGETSVPVPPDGVQSGSIGWKRAAVFVGSAVAAAAAIVLTIWGLAGLRSLSGQSAALAPSVSLRIPSASPTSGSESATRPAAAPQAAGPPRGGQSPGGGPPAAPRPAPPLAAPASPPLSAAKPTLPAGGAPQPPVPQAAVSAGPPAKPATSSTPAEEARATAPPAPPDSA